MTSLRFAAAVAMLGVLAIAWPPKTVVADEGLVPVGDQFQVNSYTTDSQFSADLVLNPEGSFVVVWASYGSSGTDTDYTSIQGQRFNPNSAPAGPEFQVNTYTTAYQYQPAMAADEQGNFVVVWASYGSSTDTSYNSVQARRYDADGAPLGGQFEVNTYTTNYQWRPAVAAEPQGSFVVAWESYGSSYTDSDYQSVQMQRYDTTGMPVGGQIQVNSYTTDSQWTPAVAMDGQGNFVVVWTSNGSPETDPNISIQGQRYDASGAPLAGQFQVNSYTTGTQREVAVAADTLGNFVVVWESYGSYDSDTSSTSIQAQLFDAGGSQVGGQFQVNTYSTGSQWAPSVSMDAPDTFVVAWRSAGSNGTDTSSSSVQAQLFDLSGVPDGDEFQINSYTTSSQFQPAVAANSQSDLVAVWSSSGSPGSDTDQTSVQGQRLVISLFADGFESNDTLGWSDTVPPP